MVNTTRAESLKAAWAKRRQEEVEAAMAQSAEYMANLRGDNRTISESVEILIELESQLTDNFGNCQDFYTSGENFLLSYFCSISMLL